MKSNFFTLLALAYVFATPSVLFSTAESAVECENLEKKITTIKRLDRIHKKLAKGESVLAEDFEFALSQCNNPNELTAYDASNRFYLLTRQAVYCESSYFVALHCLKKSNKHFRELGCDILYELMTTIGDRDINVRKSLLKEMIYYVNKLPEECDRGQLYSALVLSKYILLFAHTPERSDRVIELFKKANHIIKSIDSTQDVSHARDIKDARKYLEDVLVTQMILS